MGAGPVDIAATSSTDPSPADAPQVHVAAAGLQGLAFALFFIFGGVTSLNDVVIPRLKALFTLSYGQAMLVQTAYFAAYLVVSLPASMLVKRIGYLRGAAVGLLVMMAGCLLFAPAARAAAFPAFLTALFVLAAGVTLVQVVANPLISRLGPPRTAHSRPTFAQGFNSLGTTVFPYVGALLILGALPHGDMARLAGPALAAFRAQQGGVIARVYLGLAAVLAVMAAVVWSQRRRLREMATAAVNPLRVFTVLKRPRLAFGAAAIFVYVGAEVSIGSLSVSYLGQADVLGLDPAHAGRDLPIYWGGAMLGRFAGAYLLRIAAPAEVLAGACGAAMLLLLTSGLGHGALSGYALLAVGLFNSIMFPTVFGLACEGLGERAADGSGMICMAIVGGAVVPPLTGRLADLAGLHAALAVPAACYALVLAFALSAAAQKRWETPK